MPKEADHAVIYLQPDPFENPEYDHERTWSKDEIEEGDTKYIRADIAAGLVEALEEAAGRFRMYEISHLQKGTGDGNMKAITNMHVARKCEKALSKYRESKDARD